MILGSGVFYFGVNSLPQSAEEAQFYGADENNFSSSAPVNLTAYQNVDGAVVLYWSLDPIAGPLYHDIVWTVETDLVPTFDSPDLLTYTSDTHPDYIAGCVNKGMAVPTYPRLQGESRTMYWRVQGALGEGETAIVSSTFEIASAVDQVVKQAMLDSLPDIIYKKDLSAGDTNLAKLYHALGLEFDMLHMDGVLVGNDAYTRSVRDVHLAANFGSLLQISQPSTMETIDFREILRVYMREAGYSPTIGSVRRVIKAIFGVDPDFTFIRDTLDMYVDDSSSTPVVDPFWVPDPLSVPPVDEHTVWDNANLSFGVIININAPLGCTISRAFVENIVYKLTPAFAPVYITGI